ncbi:Venom allergen 5 [Folsomia candida]|uniref:Venom allergen 5 n=1 Tax=Folsomia candida TaxID=158441 RepID=A0A226D3X6_FOLCA|nr:Venom allergen 5 [Folsomia candida]
MGVTRYEGGGGGNCYFVNVPISMKNVNFNQITNRQAVDAWYYEICDEERYPKKNAKGEFNLYHDTQVLWRSSVELGMGFAVQHNEGGTEVQVAGQYYPVGNFISQEASNPNDMKPICHTEEEVCKAYKSGKPLLGDCQGKLSSLVRGCGSLYTFSLSMDHWFFRGFKSGPLAAHTPLLQTVETCVLMRLKLAFAVTPFWVALVAFCRGQNFYSSISKQFCGCSPIFAQFLWVPEKPKTPPPKTQKPEPEDDEKEESDEIKELDESGEEKHVQRLKFGFGDGEMASAGGSKLFKMLSMFDSMKGGKIKVIHIGGPGLASLLG